MKTLSARSHDVLVGGVSRGSSRGARGKGRRGRIPTPSPAADANQLGKSQESSELRAESSGSDSQPEWQPLVYEYVEAMLVALEWEDTWRTPDESD